MSKEFTISTTIFEFPDEFGLDKEGQELLLSARKALSNTYAPYSEFHVAAALLLDDGTTVIGTNQENAAYPSGLCAERVALFSASAQFPQAVFKRLAIVARSENFEVDHPVAPCGSCRQVMIEYRLKQQKPIEIILQGTKGKIYTLSDITGLLPLFFHEEGLKKGH